MKFEIVALSALSLDPSNVRKHSRKNLDATGKVPVKI